MYIDLQAPGKWVKESSNLLLACDAIGLYSDDWQARSLAGKIVVKELQGDLKRSVPAIVQHLQMIFAVTPKSNDEAIRSLLGLHALVSADVLDGVLELRCHPSDFRLYIEKTWSSLGECCRGKNEILYLGMLQTNLLECLFVPLREAGRVGTLSEAEHNVLKGLTSQEQSVLQQRPPYTVLKHCEKQACIWKTIRGQLKPILLSLLRLKSELVLHRMVPREFPICMVKEGAAATRQWLESAQQDLLCFIDRTEQCMIPILPISEVESLKDQLGAMRKAIRITIREKIAQLV